MLLVWRRKCATRIVPRNAARCLRRAWGRRAAIQSRLPMNQRLTPSTALLLTTAPQPWAGNAGVGRLPQGLVPPVTLNFLRWLIAGLILLPLAGWVLHRDSPLWAQWRRFAVLGLAGVGCYNALQYLARKTSTPLNVTLVGASVPVFMLAFGAMFFGRHPSRRQYVGA